MTTSPKLRLEMLLATLLTTKRHTPLSGDVRVSVAGTASRVRVEANQMAQFETDLSRGVRLIPVEIQAPGQFRPNEVDSNSHDTRRLGVQVRVALQ